MLTFRIFFNECCCGVFIKYSIVSKELTARVVFSRTRRRLSSSTFNAVWLYVGRSNISSKSCIRTLLLIFCFNWSAYGIFEKKCGFKYDMIWYAQTSLIWRNTRHTHYQYHRTTSKWPECISIHRNHYEQPKDSYVLYSLLGRLYFSVIRIRRILIQHFDIKIFRQTDWKCLICCKIPPTQLLFFCASDFKSNLDLRWILVHRYTACTVDFKPEAHGAANAYKKGRTLAAKSEKKFSSVYLVVSESLNRTGLSLFHFIAHP